MASRKPVTLITGASAGIGVALAEEFSDHGHALALVARRAPELKALADRIEERGRPRPLVLAIDLTHRDAVSRIGEALREAGVEPQYVVNNAGFGLLGRAAEHDRGEQLAMVDLNVRALTELSLRFVDALERQRGGILNVASIAAFMPGPGMAVYHATKAYVLSFSEALHRELSHRGVRVTALCPGPVATEFQARAGIPKGYMPSILARSPQRVARDGYAGLMRGARVVVPGSTNRLAAMLPRLVPRALMLAFMRSNMRKLPR
jgi:short-subunit dehydrogenase